MERMLGDFCAGRNHALRFSTAAWRIGIANVCLTMHLCIGMGCRRQSRKPPGDGLRSHFRAVADDNPPPPR
jgi:hypothetical protein